MKTVRVHQFGGPEVLSYDDVPAPAVAAGQALVHVQVAGVNFIDTYQRSGLYQLPLPLTLGQEACGVVEAIGEGVTEVKVGDRVTYAMTQGAYAEYQIVPSWKCVPVPDKITAAQAVAAMVQGMTAHYLTYSTYPLKKGDTALIHAAAGGTGALVVQVAKRLGARVIGTVSTQEKAEIAKKAGADEIILYTEQDFEVEVKRLTDGKGVDVIYDSVGQTTFEKGLNCLHPRGMMVLFGQSSGAVSPVNPLILMNKGSLYITRPTLGHYSATREELLWRANDVFNWFLAGELEIHVDKSYALKDAADAHRYLEGRGSKGKVVLEV
ncbi:MAG: quinone oxidoreductase [Anaerolineae bacterium]